MKVFGGQTFADQGEARGCDIYDFEIFKTPDCHSEPGDSGSSYFGAVKGASFRHALLGLPLQRDESSHIDFA